MAIACLLPLREFAEKIDTSYGPISGARSSHHFLRRSGKSIQWSVFATEELAKFRVVIAAKVASIGLLLGVLNCQSLSTIENWSQITNTLLAQAAERRDLLYKELSQQATTHHGALSADITEARTQVKNEISSAEGEAGKRHDHMINRAEQHTNDLRALGHRMDRVYGDTCSNIKDVVDVCSRARLGNEQRFRSAEGRYQKLGVEIKSLRYQQQQTSSRVSSSLQAVFVQIQIVRAIGASLLGSLIPFSEKVLRYLRDNMQTNLETYALLLKIQADMPKKLENGNLILFQDVLGRTKSLPYEYFRHWGIFESMLRCEFIGLPGEDKVSQGQYIIIDGTLPGVEIGRHAWQEKVSLGLVSRCPSSSTLCTSSGGVVRDHGALEKIVSPEEFAVAQCPYCGLAFAPQSPSEIRTAADEELTP